MSAFSDIWITATNKVPYHKRVGSSEWSKTECSGISIWQTKPSDNDKSITLTVDTNTHKLIVIGQFYESVNTKILLSECIAYTEKKTTQFNDPAGHYIIFVISKVNGSTHVFTDRFGTYHGYYSSESGNKAISTYFIGLAKHTAKRDLDWEGVAGFLSIGYFPKDSTYLSNIKIFLPASVYSFDNELNFEEHRRYWDWSYEPKERSLEECLEELDNVMKSSLSFASIDRRVALPISGGLDSRTLAGVMSRLQDNYKSIWSYSYGFTSGSRETAIAKQVSNKCNFDFNSYVVPDYLFAEIDSVIDSVELFQYVDGTRQICMKQQLKENADIVIGGHWGDVWFNDMDITPEDDALIHAFRKKIIKKGSSTLLNIFSEYTPKAQEQLESGFRDYVYKYRHIKNSNYKFKIYKTDQWSFRWTLASIRAYRSAITPVLPFYDKNVVSLLTQVPTRLHKGRHLQIEYLKQYYPSLAKIKWQEYNSNLYNYKWLNNRNLIYRSMKKVQRTFSPQKKIIRNADVFYLHAEGRKRLEEVLKGAKLQEIVPLKKVELLLDNYYKDPSAANTYAVSMLHTFAQFARIVL